MGYSLNAVQAEAVLQALKQNYSVYAPKRFPKQGRYSDTDVIKYAEVEHYEDIVWQVKSDYPAKEVLTPIQQAIFYFTEDEYRASKGPKKPILILARPCDINAQHVQAKIYAGNGGYTDLYYERMREKVKFALMECNGGDDTCFCVSMGTNKTDDYSLALKFSDEGVQVQVTDEAFAPYFEGMPQAGYTPAFVEENELKVTVPDLDDKAVCLALKSHPMWKEFDGRCISCGACTVACSTCTCFPTRDVIYGDHPEVGERRRVTASCQIAGFDPMRPTRLTSKPTQIVVPEFAWDNMIAEGPNAFVHDGKIFLIYSGSLVGIDYTTGLVTALAGRNADLTDPAAWSKLDYPLQKSGIYNGQWQLGTGHGMWSHDEDGNLIYVFHNAEYDNGRYGGRDAQVRRVHWSAEGMPILDMQSMEELNPDYADVTMEINVADAV